MSDTGKPTVVVVNGTAGEGYWATYYLLKTGLFNVKATVRRPDSQLSQKLKDLDVDGNRCDVVQAATNDQGALEKAFDGATAIYGTSVYNIYAKRYRPANPEEREQCRAVVNAARNTSSLEHFVWQTMTRFELPPEEIGLEAPIHFRTKWQFEEVIQDYDLPWTFLRQPAYMRQVKFGLQYKNRLVYPYSPDSRLSFVSEVDLGKFVAGIMQQRDEHLHKVVNGVTEVITPVELAERIARFKSGFKSHYRQASWIENAIFDQIIVGLKPAFNYPKQINHNIMAGNYFSMYEKDKAYCEKLTGDWGLTTLEDWLDDWFAGRI